MNQIVRLALEEDVGTGDVTSAACIPESQLAKGRFLAREPLVIAGLNLLAEVYDARGGVDDLRLPDPQRRFCDFRGAGRLVCGAGDGDEDEVLKCGTSPVTARRW